jgi:hypothetical protein
MLVNKIRQKKLKKAEFKLEKASNIEFLFKLN